MAKIRDTATVILVDGVPKMQRRRSSNGTRASRVERRDVDRRVMKMAMELAGGDVRRIKAIDRETVEILPER